VRIRTGLATCVLAAPLLILPTAIARNDPALPIHDGVGGDFSARSSLGRMVESSELRGQVVLLFFGYTSCQDICPATMSRLAALTKKLGARADDVQVILFTIDPDNDTEAHMKEYLARFDDRFVGLTTSEKETNRIAGMFMVKHDASHGMEVTTEHNRSKAFTDSAFLYAHSQQIYLLDKRGRTRGYFFVGTPLEEMEAAVLALLAE
jgi:protein SCO1/2